MRRPWCSATRSIIRCSAVSMPSPSRSNFTSPAAAQSSLSHCTTVRPSIRAHSTGTTSATGRSQMTMPPEWMPRWRGKPRSWFASSPTCSGMPATLPALHAVPPLDLLAPRVLLARREPQRLRDVAHRRPGPVADHVRHLRRPVAPVAAVDVLDDLLAAARLDVEVDVRVAVAGRGQEPLEQQAVRHRVHVRDPQRVADRGVRRRAAALAEDPRRAAERHDVVHDQEVAGELPGLDDRQLPLHGGDGLGVLGVAAVALQDAAAGELAQPLSPPCGPAGSRTGAGPGRPDRSRTRTPHRTPPPAPPPRDGGRRTGPPSPRPSAGARCPRAAANRRPRPGCAGPGPPPAPWPAGTAPAWRSGRRCWRPWAARRRRRGRPGRR